MLDPGGYMESVLGGSQRVAHVLIVVVGSSRGAVVMKQLAGFMSEADALRSQLGLTFRIVDVPHVAQIVHEAVAHMPDVLVVLPNWKDTPEQVIAAFRAVFERHVRPLVVFMDTYDPTSSPHFGVLPFVDRYLKRSLLVDLSGYQREYQGGQVLSHHAATVLGVDLKGWHFGSALPLEHAHKLRSCWNFGIGSDFAMLLRRSIQFAPRWSRRIFDLNCRIGLSSAEASEETWYKASRLDAARVLKSMHRYRCTGDTRIGRRRYLFELLQSKIVFSPFGWGEVCFRDYEAVCAGCLLIKPDMSHLATSPNIFRPHETYIPVSWDYHNLARTVDDALANPERSANIAQHAREVMQKYYQERGFVQDLAQSLQGLCSMPDNQIATSSASHLSNDSLGTHPEAATTS
jgi:hypothetical protein